MNEASIKGYKLQLEDLIKSLDALLTEIGRIEANEEHLKRKADIILQKERGLAKREVIVNTNKSKIDVQKEEIGNLLKKLEEEKKELNQLKAKREEQKKILISKEEEVDRKVTELSALEEKKKEIDDREEELIKEKEGIDQREVMVKKEKMLARKRKEALDIRERTLKAKQTKLQKFLDLSEGM